MPSAEAAHLVRQLRRNRMRRQATAVALIAPLFLFLVVNFVVPVGLILIQSVDDREVGTILPRTFAAIKTWDGVGLPDDATFAGLYADLRDARAAKTVAIAATRLNTNKSGFQALIGKTARMVAASDPHSPRSALVEIDERWGDTAWWLPVRSAAAPFTAIYLLSGLDLTIDDAGSMRLVPESRRIFIEVWLRTFKMAAIITALSVVLGYPLAFFLANTRRNVANLLLIFVLLPFWTSLLVRSTAWVALLQSHGVINDLALYLRLESEPAQLIHNRFGVYVTMTHVLLPYVVLPLYGVMRRISSSYVRAAKSLGANPLVAFWRVYFPQTVHGVAAGAILVFILAVGFYITPALVGGSNDQMISYFVAYYTNESLNWNAAAALSVLLLLFTVALFLVFNRVFGLARLTVR
jgi:putative spermidine/putrescine transport system permease protein